MPHNRIVVTGRLGTEEVWSTSLRFALGTDPSVPAVAVSGLNGFAAAIRDELADDLTILRNCISSDGAVKGIQAQIIANDGTLFAQSDVFATTVAGLGNPNMPYQSAVVISSLTGIPGARHRGRNYWPCVGGKLLLAGGRLTTPTLPQDIVNNWANWVDHIGVMAAETGEGTGIPVMYSPTRNAVTPVTLWRCGDVVDTQRRRRDGLLENYFTAAAV